jgi:hypothetical protein
MYEKTSNTVSRKLFMCGRIRRGKETVKKTFREVKAGKVVKTGDGASGPSQFIGRASRTNPGQILRLGRSLALPPPA